MHRFHFHLPPRHEVLHKLFEPAKYFSTVSNSASIMFHNFYSECVIAGSGKNDLCHCTLLPKCQIIGHPMSHRNKA